MKVISTSIEAAALRELSDFVCQYDHAWDRGNPTIAEFRILTAADGLIDFANNHILPNVPSLEGYFQFLETCASVAMQPGDIRRPKVLSAAASLRRLCVVVDAAAISNEASTARTL